MCVNLRELVNELDSLSEYNVEVLEDGTVLMVCVKEAKPVVSRKEKESRLYRALLKQEELLSWG